ncbi:MAG: SoxR reducing system RseC family protein [Phycisphaerae bacterium]|nr:SoxR reducing system RseC family protein [Phycisphaerae bacterium]
MPCNVPGGLAGWPLATAAFFVFVLPVGLAIAGAALIGRDPNRQMLGALAGFVVGVVLAGVVAKILRRRVKNKTDSTNFTN